MKKVSMFLQLTVEETEIICGKLRNLASSYILNGEDEKAHHLLREIMGIENDIKEAMQNESVEI